MSHSAFSFSVSPTQEALPSLLTKSLLILCFKALMWPHMYVTEVESHIHYKIIWYVKQPGLEPKSSDCVPRVLHGILPGSFMEEKRKCSKDHISQVSIGILPGSFMEEKKKMFQRPYFPSLLLRHAT